MRRVVNQFDPGGHGDLVARFVRVNRTMRQQANRTLAELASKSRSDLLWSGEFVRLPGSRLTRTFGEKRRYISGSTLVDEEVHLGSDLVSIRNAPVPAANDGIVIFADNLGVYGQCLVIDHGYSVQSIYYHLSKIEVTVGDRVRKRQRIGRTGITGLTDGDVLHFAVQVNGIPVDPADWWSEQILLKNLFGEGLP
jgi:murein DD-endopeptidase MepM/ murein hydrolase activator NlpD